MLSPVTSQKPETCEVQKSQIKTPKPKLANNIDNVFMHLTNYSLNKRNKDAYVPAGGGKFNGEGSGEDGAGVFGAGVVATTLGVARAASRAIRTDWPGFIVVRGLVARSFGMLLICARAMAVSGARSGRRQKVGLDGSGVGVRVFCGCARAAAAYCG